MKKLNLLLLSFCLTTLSLAQDSKLSKSQIQELSYSYGAMISQSVSNLGFSEDEKNVDEFLKGLKIGLTGDSAAFANAQGLLQNRISSKEVSADKASASKVAYSMGVSVIGGLATLVDIPAADFDFKTLGNAFVASGKGESLKYEKNFMDSVLQAYFQPLSLAYNKKMEEKKMAESAGNIQAGKDFLEKNGKKEGVFTTASGLQYEIIKEGTGPQATIKDKVKTHYHGTLIDGTIFDSSVDRGQPATFGVSQVIKGWQEGIPLMKQGAKYKFYIPQELAYGMRSPSPKIPAGATLIFEVDLLEVIKEEIPPAIAEGKAFLAENAKKEGVTTLPSGLQFQVLVAADGPKPTIADRVKTHYHGTLIDGTVFDSSVDRNQPATFGLNQVIQGWQEGIPYMSVGSKYRFFIPSNLAYGNRATGKIPAGSTLIFDVDLLEINPK
jgi:FKBP-type peptidyl-prolyl cis-trans isomerase